MSHRAAPSLTDSPLHDRFGLQPVINAGGTFTPLGVSRSPPAIGEAVAQALGEFFDIDALQGVASQALAALRGRDFVIPSDVQALCPALLTHRIHISPQTRLRGRTTQQIIADITEQVPVPVNE